MKSKIMCFITSMLVMVFSMQSCTIQGEEVCGIWFSNSDFGKMKIEITPWDKKFHGYLLEYQSGTETQKGEKSNEHIFLTDLFFQDQKYQNGKILLDQSGDSSCDIELKLLDANRLKAIYNCDGVRFEEIWQRNAYPALLAEKKEASPIQTSQTETANSSAENQKESAKTSTAPNTKIARPENLDPTQAKSKFYIIGYQELVAIEDTKALEKAIESLWTKSYEKDFSSKLSNISDNENVYLTYSDYENPNGKMAITLGYQVKNLSNVPEGLKGVTVPANDYYVYEFSGETSDYSDEMMKQWEEVALYRKGDSVDFEVYNFDANYEIEKAHIWIASK